MKRKAIIGVTGGFGTGKSTVSKMFKKLGCTLLDADRIARDAVTPGSVQYRRVVSKFGKRILKKDGMIDRKRLAGVVFKNKKKLSALNEIIHPFVIKKIKRFVRRNPKGMFVIDAPLLIEAGLTRMVDKLVVVTTDKKTQIKRAKKTPEACLADIKRRIKSQMSLIEKKRLADFIIDNNGSIKSTRKEVEKIWKEIKDGDRGSKG